MLSNYVSTNQKERDLYVKLTCFSYNTSVQETTKHTPFFLMYGREARLPIDVSLRQDPMEDPDAEKILERVQRCREDVTRIITDSQKKHLLFLPVINEQICLQWIAYGALLLEQVQPPQRLGHKL